jgi:hypothetical protein
LDLVEELGMRKWVIVGGKGTVLETQLVEEDITSHILLVGLGMDVWLVLETTFVPETRQKKNVLRTKKLTVRPRQVNLIAIGFIVPGLGIALAQTLIPQPIVAHGGK